MAYALLIISDLSFLFIHHFTFIYKLSTLPISMFIYITIYRLELKEKFVATERHAYRYG